MALFKKNKKTITHEDLLNSPIEYMTCPNCHQAINTHMKYCAYCGNEFTPISPRDFDFNRKFLHNLLFRNNKTKNITDVNQKKVEERLLSKIDYNRYSKYKCNVCGTPSDYYLCPVCGKNLAKYCPSCGTRISTNREFCQNCGNKIESNKKYAYCSNCGNKQEIKGDKINKCKNCHTSMKIISNKEYNQLNNTLLKIIKEHYNLNEEIPLFEQLNLDPTQAKHAELFLMKKMIDKNLSSEEIITELNSIKNELNLSEEEFKEKISNDLKKEIKEEFEGKGLLVLDLDLGQTREKLVSRGGFKEEKIPIVKDKHSTGTKILGTALLGGVGFAATSGVETTYKTEKKFVPSKYETEVIREPSANFIRVNSKGINLGKNIIFWNNVKEYENKKFILNSGEIIPFNFKVKSKIYPKLADLILTYDEEINKKYVSAIFEDINNYVDSLILEKIEENLEEDKNNDELLFKYAELYEKGLLTKEEFEAKKKELL